MYTHTPLALYIHNRSSSRYQQKQLPNLIIWKLPSMYMQCKNNTILMCTKYIKQTLIVHLAQYNFETLWIQIIICMSDFPYFPQQSNKAYNYLFYSQELRIASLVKSSLTMMDTYPLHHCMCLWKCLRTWKCTTLVVTTSTVNMLNVLLMIVMVVNILHAINWRDVSDN